MNAQVLHGKNPGLLKGPVPTPPEHALKATTKLGWDIWNCSIR
jgi:hypothetical protein